MFPTEYFALIETVAGAILALLLAQKYIRSRKNHHLAWTFSLIFWSIFELGVFLHDIYGSMPITEKIVALLGMYPAALWGVGMLFLLQGIFRKPWAKYFLIYTLIIYGAIIGAVVATGVRKELVVASWALLIVPGAVVACSGSFYSYFVLGRKRNILIAIAILASIVAERFWLLFQFGLDTVSEILVGVGFLIAMEPAPRKDDSPVSQVNDAN